MYVALPAQHVLQQLQPQWARLAAGEEGRGRAAPLLRQLLQINPVVEGSNETANNSSSGRGVQAWTNPLFSLKPIPPQVLARIGHLSPGVTPGVTPSESSRQEVPAVPPGQALQQVVYQYDLHAWQQTAIAQQLAQRQDGHANLSSAGSEVPSPPEEGPVPVSTPRMNIKLKWQGAAAGGAQPWPAPAWIASRRTSGAGTMVGAMVLTLQRPPHRNAPPQGDQHAVHGPGGLPRSLQQERLGQGQEVDGQELVCVVQVVPWMVRAWLHALQLTLDGQVREGERGPGSNAPSRMQPPTPPQLGGSTP